MSKWLRNIRGGERNGKEKEKKKAEVKYVNGRCWRKMEEGGACQQKKSEK